MSQNNDLISRSALKAEAIEMEIFQPYGGDGSCMGVTVGTIDCAPSVDAEAVRHGRWIVKCETHGDPYDDGQWEEWMALCSECGRIICLDDFECAKGNVGKEIAKFPYCHCGAKMDGDEDGIERKI